MSNWKTLFPASTSVTATTTTPLPTVVDVVDLRTEFNNIVLGYGGETPIGQPFILRRMRRDSSNNLVQCTCVDDVSLEPDRDYYCPYCRGRGYLWDEELVTGYKVISVSPGGSNAEINNVKLDVGVASLPAARFYFSYDTDITKDDRIIEIELTAAGSAVIPYNRISTYEIMLVRTMRGDNGKIEYFVCSGQKIDLNTLGEIS